MKDKDSKPYVPPSTYQLFQIGALAVAAIVLGMVIGFAAAIDNFQAIANAEDLTEAAAMGERWAQNYAVAAIVSCAVVGVSLLVAAVGPVMRWVVGEIHDVCTERSQAPAEEGKEAEKGA